MQMCGLRLNEDKLSIPLTITRGAVALSFTEQLLNTFALMTVCPVVLYFSPVIKRFRTYCWSI